MTTSSPFSISSRLVRLGVRALVLPVAVSAAIGVGACGSGVDQHKLDDVRHQGAALQQSGARLQSESAQLAADVRAGRITQAQADRKLERETTAITRQANKTASDAIDAVDDAKLPAGAKKALDEARQQIPTAP